MWCTSLLPIGDSHVCCGVFLYTETLLARLEVCECKSRETSLVCGELIQFRETLTIIKRNLELPDEDPFLNIIRHSEATFLSPVITDILTE